MQQRMVGVVKRLGWSWVDWVAVGAVSLCFSYLAYRYASGSFLDIYDATGHVAAVEHARNLWPQWSGWQSRELLGWHQGLLYPPLVHWLAAGLSVFVGSTMAALLTVVVCAILALPIALYTYALSLRLERSWRWVVVGAGVITLLLIPDYMGVGLRSLFQLGLVTGFVAVPLVLVSWSATEWLAWKPHWKRAALLAVLIGVLVWTHLIGAIVAIVYAAGALGYALVRRNAKLARWYASALCGGFIVAAPFAVPFVLSYGQGVGKLSGISSNIILCVAALAVVLVVHILSRRVGYALSRRAVIVAVACLGICIVDALLVRFGNSNSVLYAANVYRIQPYAFILVTVLIVQFVSAVPRLGRDAGVRLAMATVLAMVLAAIVRNPSLFEGAVVTKTESVKVQGRFLETFSRADSYPNPYAMQTTILRDSPASSWAYGLVIESAPNAPFIKSLSRSLDAGSSSSGVRTKFEPEDIILPPEKSEQMLDMFGIQHLLTLDTTLDGSIGTWRRKGVTKYYHLLKRPSQSLAETPRYPLKPVSKDWSSAVLAWWRDTRSIRELPYNAQHGVIQSRVQYAAVDVKDWTDEKIVLHIDSAVPVPVLVKMSYAADWVGATSDGVNVPVYQAAPHLMLVVAHGSLTLSR